MEYQVSYLQLTGEQFEEKVARAQEQKTECALCPRECHVNRTKERGYCQADAALKVSSFGPHFGEEKELVGRNGSGTIFFAHCNLRCVYCQNHDLSFGGQGSTITIKELAEIMLSLQNRHECSNINLVTPTHYVPQILEAVFIAAQEGLRIPLVYNCSGYEKTTTLQLLQGIIDIYMPDLKYSSLEWGQDYSDARDYFSRARTALMEMDRQVGGLETNEEGVAQRGLLVRHLVLPGGLEESKHILDFIKMELSPRTLVNVMDQYHPSHKAYIYPELNRRLSQREYEEVLRYAKMLGLRLAEK